MNSLLVLSFIGIVASSGLLVFARRIKDVGVSDSYYIPVKNRKGIYFRLEPVRKIAIVGLLCFFLGTIAALTI